MLKKLLVLLLLIQILLFSCGCFRFGDFGTINKTIVTDYGETLVFKIRYKSNPYYGYPFSYISSIHGQGDGAVVFVNYNDPGDAPKDPFTLFEHVAHTEDINLYKIKDTFLFSSETWMEPFPEKDLTNIRGYIEGTLCLIIAPEDHALFLSTFEKVPEAFVETKQLKYIQHFVPYMLEEQNTSCIPLIQRWAAGDISEEEIAINRADGYCKTDLIEWAKQFNF